MGKKLDDIYMELVARNGGGSQEKGYEFEFDLKGNFKSVSPEAAEFAGYSLEAIEIMSVWDIVSENDHDLMLENFAARKEGKTVDPYEVTMIRKDGQRIRIKVETTPIVDDDGKVILIRGKVIPI